jgi:hypothetical protein
MRRQLGNAPVHFFLTATEPVALRQKANGAKRDLTSFDANKKKQASVA